MNEDELAEYYDKADLSGDIEHAAWDTETDSDPMVVTSLRLPKSLLDWIRAEAAAHRTRPTSLIRRWLDERRTEQDGDHTSLAALAERVERLESVTLKVARSSPAAPDARVGDDEDRDLDSMADLLAALQASVDAAREDASPHTDRRHGRTEPDERQRGA